MNLRLVLASSPVSLAERYGKFSGAANTEPSFGLVCLASAAQVAGADVRIVEASSENLSIERAFAEILEFHPDVAGITATTVGIVAAGQLAERLKSVEPKLVIVIGGCHATALPEETLSEFNGFDLLVIGEGEKTLVDILEHVAKERNVPSGVIGTAERNGGGIKINLPRPIIEDLDELPMPAWSLLRGFPRAFRPSPARIKRWPCASVILTRGCPNKCTFCDRSVFGNVCRAYSPSYAVRLLKDLRYNYGVKEILMEDDTFIISKARVTEFCERLITEKVDITWSCLGRADRVDAQMLKGMKNAGCWHISFGIESGDPEILRSVNKNLDIDQITRSVQWCREAGILTKGFFMVGFPNESKASLEATLELACSLPLDDVTVMQLTPFPGSELYRTATQYGTFDKDWRRMNTIETVFVPNGFTGAEMEAVRAKILRRFYLRPGIIIRKGLRMIQNPRLAGSMFRSLLVLLRNI